MTQLFNAGQVGMCVDAIALYQTLIDPNESSFYDKVGVAPIPEGPAGRQSYKQVVTSPYDRGIRGQGRHGRGYRVLHRD